MNDRLPAIAAFLTELERLKLIYRSAYVSDLSRHENSAEHSWHLAIGLLTVARELDLHIDVPKALVMALIHDICEIDAGDTPVYGRARPDQHDRERECIERLAGCGLQFGFEVRDQAVARSQVLAVNEPVRRHAPEIFAWMQARIGECVQKGWLRDA